MNITVFGCGNVGEAVCFLLINQFKEMHLNIMEPDVKKQGKWLEIMHISGLHKNVQVTCNVPSEVEKADWIFYTAGAGIKIGQNRRAVVQQNVKLARKIFAHYSFKKEPYIVVMSNPVEAVTYYIRKFTGLDRTRVWGTGNLIDSARFSANLLRLGLVKETAEASVLGEHGKGMVLLFSEQDHLNISEAQKNKLISLTLNGAREVKMYQDATYTTVASCAVKLMRNVLEDQKVMIFNTLSDGRLTDFLQLPEPIEFSWKYDCGNNFSSVELDLSNEEITALRNSAHDLLDLLKETEHHLQGFKG